MCGVGVRGGGGVSVECCVPPTQTRLLTTTTKDIPRCRNLTANAVDTTLGDFLSTNYRLVHRHGGGGGEEGQRPQLGQKGHLHAHGWLDGEEGEARREWCMKPAEMFAQVPLAVETACSYLFTCFVSRNTKVRVSGGLEIKAPSKTVTQCAWAVRRKLSGEAGGEGCRV